MVIDIKDSKIQITILVFSLLLSSVFVLRFISNDEREDSIDKNSLTYYENKEAQLYVNDTIYYKRNDRRLMSPAVNEEYKLVFFFIAKCASSEWKRMLVRMMGSPKWCARWIHKPEVNGLKFLYDYSIDEAQEIMTSPEWKRAVFVRNPKDRVLSAFLDKVVSHSQHFTSNMCPSYGRHGYDAQKCIDNHKDFGFFLKNITTTLENKHWMPIFNQIDNKWWPYINFIGNLENISEDASKLLQSVKSEKDEISAWEHWGKTGWSDDERDCEAEGTQAFFAKERLTA